jgi:DNA-binding response OmpR family regulator
LKRILIVDDEKDVNLSSRLVLESNGFQVDSFDDPLLALENFKPNSYDLVILDIKMPKMNGFSLYREFRKLDNKANICFLTAGEMYYGTYEDIFHDLYENSFIRIPIENDDLLERVDRIMKITRRSHLTFSKNEH